MLPRPLLVSESGGDRTVATLQKLEAIAQFLKPYKALWDAHVVDFFQEKLWELVDWDWLITLRDLEMEEMLLLPSGFLQESWPASLQSFVGTAHALALQREPRLSGQMDRANTLQVAHLGSVVAQGMSSKKRHEIGLLAALVSSVAHEVKATDVIDVGAGQGYLAQVLAFDYQLPVVALDVSKHHANVTKERAVKIKKHYESRLRLSDKESHQKVLGPQTYTCRVASGSATTSLSCMMPMLDFHSLSGSPHASQAKKQSRSVVLAGLHACGDLSASILRAFSDCHEVKAVVCVGCCYNLLSEDASGHPGCDCGFPLSRGAKSLGLQLDRNGRDLACQSAARWRECGTGAAQQNFDTHAFRAAFQLVLHRFYPNIATASPSVGRLGKAQRRRQARRDAESTTRENPSSNSSLPEEGRIRPLAKQAKEPCVSSRRDAFEEYTNEALIRMGLAPVPRQLVQDIWREIGPHLDFIGPFWTLRAVLAPALETFILLDRLLYLEELEARSSFQHSPRLVPLFDPAISPRNVAIVAVKK